MFKGGVTNGVQSCENRKQEMNVMGTEHNGYREYARVEQEVNINRETKKKEEQSQDKRHSWKEYP